MKNYVVVGLGYGDEGKGLVTNWLCEKNPNSLVIRFNGGHQAGHTVMLKDGKKHTFSNFGSGTLRGCPTYWSKYCTVEPVGFLKERKALVEMGVEPSIYVDTLCPVTTPWDIAYNQIMEEINGHGTVGVGFGATIARQEAYYKLCVGDLPYKRVVDEKINNISRYYSNLLQHSDRSIQDKFINKVSYNGRGFNIDEYLSHIMIVQEKYFFSHSHSRASLIFEGAQGIMLDMDFGFFPNVTRSNTTSKNALEIVERNGLEYPEIMYVSRAYQTRHGHGFMGNENYKNLLHLREEEYEINVSGGWQGDFRKSLLDIDLLNYALSCDNNFSNGLRKTLVMTCINQIEGEHLVTKDNKVLPFSPYPINIDNFLNSYSPYGELLGERKEKEILI